MHAEGCLVVVELAATARGFAGVWTYLVALPPVFLFFRLECAPSPLALRAWVRVLAWGLAHRAEHYAAQCYDQGVGVRSLIHFDARGKNEQRVWASIFPVLPAWAERRPASLCSPSA